MYDLWLERWSKTHHFAGTQKLHEMIQQPYDLFKPGWADQYVVGMINQVAQAMDDFITSQVRPGSLCTIVRSTF
jgi:peroxidase